MKKNKETTYCKCQDVKRNKIILKGINMCMVCWCPIEEKEEK